MSSADRPVRVMVAGVGGASLGTEIMKSLALADGYEVFGCDISPTAFGLYDPGFRKTYLIDPGNYIDGVLNACADAQVGFVVPGGERPMSLLADADSSLRDAGVTLLGNGADVVALCSDKHATFERLSALGIRIPRTANVSDRSDVSYVGIPCIVKPATGTGGSASVFFATDVDEAMIYADYIRKIGSVPLAQEYITPDEGEFTIGVLSLPDKSIVGSIALKRSLEAKLSVAYRGRGGVVSSGYSQGFIGKFDTLCQQAEAIAASVGSCGPLNIQGRVLDGDLMPFEINPRVSASTYLRAMAGFNELDLLIRYHVSGRVPGRPLIRPGWYLRSLSEQFVAQEEISRWSLG